MHHFVCLYHDFIILKFSYSSLNGKQLKIVYQEEAYFLQDLHRHVYLHGGMGYGMTEFNFEIDDDGNPYWVVSLYDHAIGYGGANAVGTAVVDAQSGEVNIYSIKDTPSWVDRIQPESFVTNHFILHFSPHNRTGKELLHDTPFSVFQLNSRHCM